ncbi:hypothetical protein [Herbaspirillum huttiense]|uniref:hypothetical protein n=1 Tax=Herbaspirillum huttiense TaxID=863372 RepID=UPI002E7A2E03|nr:hypothetical protein [Herbaspirillum huttiense]MEE1636376.1 hypothetical protein [Herbaspirillum huttiense NC40101]
MTTAIDMSKVSSKAMLKELSSRGRQKGEEGIALAVENAGDCWLDNILPVFHDWLMVRTEAFAIEDFRIYVEHHRPELCPVSNKAWGVMPSAAKSRGWIMRCGIRPAISPKTHGHDVKLYRVVA